VRGLHFQVPPTAQAKLVWSVRGAVLDVVVDLRRGSPTFGRHVAVELSPADGQLYVPVGFAHGYCTLEADTEVVYKVSAPYAPDHEGGVLWNDPDLAIPWPIADADAVLAARDAALPRLADLPSVFAWT
jgi:dTDP-4-dehydrorhamnose 3,5-epimerase